jgi:hypothetical protein
MNLDISHELERLCKIRLACGIRTNEDVEISEVNIENIEAFEVFQSKSPNCHGV